MVFNNSQNGAEENLITMESKNHNSQLSISDQAVFPLLEERLVVNLTRQKAGEIVVRKEIETHIMTVKFPVRNEKIIVEQTSPKYMKVAEVNLGELTLLGQEIQDKANSEILELISNGDSVVVDAKNSRKVIKGDFNSLEDAHDFLDLVFSDCSITKGMIRVELVSSDT